LGSWDGITTSLSNAVTTAGTSNDGFNQNDLPAPSPGTMGEHNSRQTIVNSTAFLMPLEIHIFSSDIYKLIEGNSHGKEFDTDSTNQDHIAQV
jgi:hypothetical protein